MPEAYQAYPDWYNKNILAMYLEYSVFDIQLLGAWDNVAASYSMVTDRHMEQLQL